MKYRTLNKVTKKPENSRKNVPLEVSFEIVFNYFVYIWIPLRTNQS